MVGTRLKHKKMYLHASDNVVLYIFIACVHTFKAHNIMPMLESSLVITIYESYQDNGSYFFVYLLNHAFGELLFCMCLPLI